MNGTWKTTDSGGGKLAFLIICGLLLLGSGGAVAAVSAAVIDALWAALGVTVMVVIGVGAVVVHLARNPSQEGIVRLPGVRMPQRYELPDPQRAAIGEAAPRELHQHVHYHYHEGRGRLVSKRSSRRDQRPEQ